MRIAVGRAGRARIAVLAAAAFLALTACFPWQASSPSRPASSQKKTLHVLAIWTGEEQSSFLAAIKPFEDRTGVRVSYEGTGDASAILGARVQSGRPPDLVGFSSPAPLARYAKSGDLKALDGGVLDMPTTRAQYSQPWLDLASVDGRLYGIVVRAELTGQIWYDPRSAKGFGLTDSSVPRTWEQVISLSNKIKGGGRTPWCIGLQSGAAPGWPGTDWIADIVLRQAGPQKYQDWYSGRLKWTSPELKQAWRTWGTIVADPKMLYGGRATVAATSVDVAANPLFSSPPGCYLYHQAAFATTSFEPANSNLKPVQDFDFFPFPDIDPQYAGAQQVSADLFGMAKDSREARDLIRYLASPAAQAIWVARGGALSANREVAGGAYPDPLSKQAAGVLTTARMAEPAATAAMPDRMTQAFFAAVRAYAKDPTSLDAQLAILDKVQAESYR